MAHVIRDSFAFRNTFADFVNSGSEKDRWSSQANQIGVSTRTRFGRGRSITRGATGNETLAKTGVANAAVWFFLFSFCQTDTGNANVGTHIRLFDSGTTQCAITFYGDGAIRVYRGNVSTLLQTFTSAFSNNSWEHYAIKITVDGTNGSVAIRKNGSTSDTLFVGSLDLTSTANNFANGFDILVTQASFLPNQFVQDFWAFTGNTGYPNDWLGDVCAVQMMPTLDTAQLDFSRTSSGSLSIGNSSSGSTFAVSANVLYTGDLFAPTQGGRMASATAEFNAGFTGNAKLALYKADGGGVGGLSESEPGLLVAVSDAVVNPGSGANSFTFSTNPPVMNGLSYFFALLTDAAATMRRVTGTGTARSFTTTYAGGFPSDLTKDTASAANQRLTIYATLTATNAGCVSDDTHDGTTTIVHSAAYAAQDLYELDPMFLTPTAVKSVSILARALKTDSAAKTFKLSGRSGSTNFNGLERPLNTSFQEYEFIQDTDPNTGTDWTAAAINALLVGPKGSQDNTLFIPSANLTLSAVAPTVA